ncbi:tRNA lysidine(34) synthetase TilS [uncultured Micrococcus sp.]|uniref:tRNA lysidine(34) synthetase TilS n=1 Tax=uncultured Micrococcus sp. TaxID=114051 RepID=UPI00259626D6|nr:tRNA lysidine(34) synthetase TilS [uncultured Micrococcus sp.]
MRPLESGAGLPALTGPWPPTTRWPEPLHRAVRALRDAVDAATGEPEPPGATTAVTGEPPVRAGRVLLAVSGGADSLALAVTAAVVADTRDGARRGGPDRFAAVCVDHGLQPGSADVARAAVAVLHGIGLDRASVVPVRRGGDRVEAEASDGFEGHARRLRYTALAEAAATVGADVVLTAHTADDQAEQVLLALARGSGTRSVAGIPACGPLPCAESSTSRVVRPLLGLSRVDLERICAWAGVRWWDDPQNTDPDMRRVRVRHRLLPALEDPETGLGAGTRAGLVRSARIAAEDAAALDAWAERAFDALRVVDGAAASTVRLRLDGLRELPPAVRHRVVLRAARLCGAEDLTRERVLAAAALVEAVPGASAGPVELPGGVRVRRRRPGRRRAARTVHPDGAAQGDALARACATLDFIPAAPRPSQRSSV